MNFQQLGKKAIALLLYYENPREDFTQKCPFSKVFHNLRRSYSELSRKVICLHMHDTNPWTLEAWHLRLALRRHGVAVDTPDECLSFRPLKGPSPSLQGREIPERSKV